MTDNRRDPRPAQKGPDNWRSLGLSVGLHVVIAVLFLIGWHWSSPVMQTEPNYITAQLVSAPMQPQSHPAPKTAHDQKAKEEARKKQAEEHKKQEEQRRREEARKKAEEKRKQEQAREQAEKKREQKEAEKRAKEKQRQEEARKKAELKRQQEAEARKKAEAERQKKAEEARRKAQEEKLQKLAQQAVQQQKQEEQAKKLAEAAAAAAKAQKQQAQSEQQKYSALIRQRLEEHWNLPPSASKSLTTVVRIRLLPTGELAGVEIVKSSGNAAFDNSVLNAVRSISSYPVPDNVAIFNQYFRQFTIEFNPENLH